MSIKLLDSDVCCFQLKDMAMDNWRLVLLGSVSISKEVLLQRIPQMLVISNQGHVVYLLDNIKIDGTSKHLLHSVKIDGFILCSLQVWSSIKFKLVLL